MNLDEAEILIEPAVAPGGVWADFGSGCGLFSRALARLVGSSGKVFAIDRDERALAELASSGKSGRGAPILAMPGDFLKLSGIAGLQRVRLDGALFANSLHYTPEPALVLSGVSELLREDGKVIIVEYDRRAANRWVPHPIPSDRLSDVASAAGWGVAAFVGRRTSAFGGSMYCALLERSGADESPDDPDPPPQRPSI